MQMVVQFAQSFAISTFIFAKFVCLIILLVGCEFLLIAFASKILNMSSITKVIACSKLFIQLAYWMVGEDWKYGATTTWCIK